MLKKIEKENELDKYNTYDDDDIVYNIKTDTIKELFSEDTYVQTSCFLCDYKYSFPTDKAYDDICPLQNKSISIWDSGCLNGLYDGFTNACYDKDVEEAVRIAKLIAEKPERND